VKILVMAACLSSGVSFAATAGFNFDRSADFSKYKTYRFIELKGAVDPLNEIEKVQVRRALEKALAERGLEPGGEDAHLGVAYQVGFGNNQQYTTYNSGGPWGYGPGWGRGWGWGWGGAGGISQTTSSTVIMGTLLLDMYDITEHRLVWQGQVSETVDPLRDPEKRLKRLDNALEKMLKYYPPKEPK